MSEVLEDDCVRCGVRLYLDKNTDPSWPLWLDDDGGYATCGDRDPHIPGSWMR